MNAVNSKLSQNSVSRRDFLKTSAVSAASAAMLASGNYAFARERRYKGRHNRLRRPRVGRGANACESAAGVELIAMADLFPTISRTRRRSLSRRSATSSR